MSAPSSPPKRPRLSLQIKALANDPSGRASRSVAAAVDVKSPTAFNTLSNVYATAVDRSTPAQEKPPTAIPGRGRRPVLRLQTQGMTASDRRAQSPYLGPYLDTPMTAQPASPAVAREICLPSTAITATPPLSAQPPDQSGAQVFTFDDDAAAAASDAQNPKRRATVPAAGANRTVPYTHPRSLRSILRNSPLPPPSTRSPESPRRQSRRLQEKAARRVAYNSPLTQTITTTKYTKSHIELLAEEEATPVSPSASSSDGDSSLDMAMADADTRDGGQTPGPFDEVRRRVASGRQASTPVALSPTSGGVRKRSGRRREKKRRWVWTIGQDGDDDDDDDDDDDENSRVATPAPVQGRDPAAPAAPVVSVPILAVPTPRSRTRNQTQLAKVTTPNQQQVPLLAVPVPPVRALPSSSSSSSAPAAAANLPNPPNPPAADQAAPAPTTTTTTTTTSQPQSEPQPQPPQPTQTGQPTDNRHTSPSPSPSRQPTPELLLGIGSGCADSGGGVAEPPTPSVESTTASQGSSSVSEGSIGGSIGSIGADDVEMSDVSSVFTSEDGGDDKGAEDGGRRGEKRGREKEEIRVRRLQGGEGREEEDGWKPSAMYYAFGKGNANSNGSGCYYYPGGGGNDGGDGDVDMDGGTPRGGGSGSGSGRRDWAPPPWREGAGGVGLVSGGGGGGGGGW